MLFTGATAPIVVPYLCTEDWDGGDFLTYPQRKGWDIALWEPSGTGSQLDTGGRSLKEMSAFLQVWLLFGLLESVLGIKIPKEDFIRLGEDGKQAVITTTRLKHYLEDWRHRMISLSEAEKDHKATVIWECLSEAASVNSHLNFQLFYGEAMSDSEPLLEALFCQTLLDSALRRALLDILPDTWWSLMDTSGNNLLLLWDRMVAAGWCPYTVSFLEDQLQPDAQAFVFSLGTLRAQQDHSPCISAGFDQIGCHCVAGEPNVPTTLKAKHVTPDCGCQPLRPPMQDIIEQIEGGWIPILAIATSNDTEHIEILTGGRKPDLESKLGGYFALSHVWTDGLGNSEDNTLPTCQVRRLAHLLHTLDDTELAEVARSEMHNDLGKGRLTIHFWLDVFCIPVQPQFQKIRDVCIRQMHEIYLTAVGVIVLDPDLQRVTNNSTPVEIVARLLGSLWRTRLWTYQEGSLAIIMYIPGQNCIFDLSKLETVITEFSDAEDEEAPDKTNRDIVEFQVARSLMVACSRTIRRSWARLDLERDSEGALKGMLQAMSHRSTSREDDETICIATFMGMDPTPLLDTLPQYRMTTLLQNLPSIPKSTLFARGPRLQTPGFRWAPLTFMAPYGIRDKQVFPITYAPDPAEPKARVPIPSSFLHPKGLGLAIFFSGLRLASLPQVPTPENFSIVTDDGKGYLVTFHDSGLKQTWTEISPENFVGSAVILFAHPKFNSCKQALLVEMLGQKSEECYSRCKWKCLLSVDDLDQVELVGKRAEMVRDHRFAGEYIPYQWWVID